MDEVFGLDMTAAARRRLYVSARAQFEPVRLMPPLTLVGLTGAGGECHHALGPEGRAMKGIADRAAMAENTSRGLFVLVLLFLVLIGIIIVFSRTFITHDCRSRPGDIDDRTDRCLVLPLVLMGVTIFQLTRLIRQRALRQPGAGLRLRLLLFFILVAVLSAGPQAMLGITFVNSAMGTWFSSSIGEALRSARDLVISYYNERLDSLGSFMDGPLAPTLLGEFRGVPGAGLAGNPVGEPGASAPFSCSSRTGKRWHSPGTPGPAWTRRPPPAARSARTART